MWHDDGLSAVAQREGEATTKRFTGIIRIIWHYNSAVIIIALKEIRQNYKCLVAGCKVFPCHTSFSSQSFFSLPIRPCVLIAEKKAPPTIFLCIYLDIIFKNGCPNAGQCETVINLIYCLAQGAAWKNLFPAYSVQHIIQPANMILGFVTLNDDLPSNSYV